MPRIETDQISPGKPIQLFIPTATNSGRVPTEWTNLAEAPDFSIPAAGGDGTPDLDNLGRELRPGEVYIETPLKVVNTTATTFWVQLRMVLQGDAGQAILLTPQLPVPAGEGIDVAIQGQRLLKSDLSNTQPGGRLQIRAENGTALEVFGSAIELEMQTHAPAAEVQ